MNKLGLPARNVTQDKTGQLGWLAINVGSQLIFMDMPKYVKT